MNSIESELAASLEGRRNQGNVRKLRDGFGLVDFTSHDYLGFARCARLKESIGLAWAHYERSPFIGSTGSRLLTGAHALTMTLEEEIAAFHGAEAALIFNSGYTANVGLIFSIAKPRHTILFDASVHASLHDGMQLSKARCLSWRHNDLSHLETRLQQCQGTVVLVCIESIYSCDGSIAPLKDVCSLCERYGASLIVDESHATGILGERGEGLVCAEGCQQRVFARIHTFSKALGVFGAAILGSPLLKDYLINFSRPLIYSTALPFPVLIAIRCAYKKNAEASEERAELFKRIEYFKQQKETCNLFFIKSDAHIQAACIPGNHQVKEMARCLWQEGFDVRPLTSPTVKPGAEQLRFCLHAFNTDDEIDNLFSFLRVLGRNVQSGEMKCAS